MSLFTQKELAKYSLTKALGEIANQTVRGYHGQVSGLEREIHDTLAARVTDLTGSGPTGFLLPLAALKAMNVTSGPAGGFLVGTELEPIVPALRAKSVVIAMGATLFEGLRSTCGVPIESTTSTAQWLAELETLSGTDSTYKQTTMSPRRVASMATVSRQMLNQNSLGVENFMRDSLLRTIASAIDKGAISGAGNAEPTGILNWEGTGSATFSGAVTRAKLISIQDTLTAASVGNTPDSKLGFVTSPVVASKWQLAPEVATFPRFLWEGNQWEGVVTGLPARSTTNVLDNRVIAADWSKLVIGLWGEAAEILVDSFAQKKSALVEIMCTAFADCGPANASNFVVSTDTGAA